MRLGRGADQDGVNGGIIDDFSAVWDNARNSKLLGHDSSRISVKVGDRRSGCFGQPERQSLGMHFADPAGANDANSKLLFRQESLLGRQLGEILLNRLQILAIAQGAFFWRAHSRQYILFYQYVALVSRVLQPAQHSWKIHAALPQFRENSVSQ